MNAFDRVMNTLQGVSTDRTPVLAVLGAYGSRLVQTDLRKLYSDADTYVASQQALQDSLGFDLVLAPFDYSAIAEAFGGEAAFFDNQPPNMKRPAATNAEEVLALPLPDPQRTGRLPLVLDVARRLSAIYRNEVPLFAAIPGCCALPALTMGLEYWINTVLFDEPAARRVLSHTSTFFVHWANMLLASGVNGLIVTEGMAASQVSSRELFAKFFFPHIEATFAQVHGPMVFHHTGGQINHILDLVRNLPGLVGVAVSSKDDLNEARQRLGGEMTLIGNLDNLSFSKATAEEMYRQSMACLKVAAPSGRFMLANSGADIPIDTPPENLQAMLAAANDFAKAGEADNE